VLSVATNLVDQLMRDFRGDTLGRVASALGENPARIETALGSVLPAILGGLTGKASTIAGANVLLDLIRLNQLDSPHHRDVTAAVAAPDGVINLINAGRPALDSALGARTSAVVDWISSRAGINRSSAISLLTIALPLVIGQIVGLVGPGRLNAWNLKTLLTEQRRFLAELPGLDAALSVVDARRVHPFPRARDAVTDAAQTQIWTAWWEWALQIVLIALIPLAFSLGRPADSQLGVQSQIPVAQAGVAVLAAALMAPSPGEFVDRRLPNDITIRIPSRGSESRLVALIEDPDARLDKQMWFSLDRLEFETGSSTLKASSREQLRNIAAILTAYPNVHVKIGGYTDNVGDDTDNLKLSADRATTTMFEIASFGIDRSRLQAEGYGEQDPVADNVTAEGRQRNRRIDIRLTKK
jgi:OmpA-OmpF porin, OOP family